MKSEPSKHLTSKANSKNRQPKRFVEKGDYPISQEWMNLQEAPLFWVDLAEDSRLQEVHDNLVQLEERLRALVGVPLSFIENARAQFTEIVLQKLPAPLREKVLKAWRGELGKNQ